MYKKLQFLVPTVDLSVNSFTCWKLQFGLKNAEDLSIILMTHTSTVFVMLISKLHIGMHWNFAHSLTEKHFFYIGK